MINLIKDTLNRNLGKHIFKCRICKKEGLSNTCTVREMMQGRREEFKYFECPECGCLQIVQIPENLGDYYGDNYYSFGLRVDSDVLFDAPVSEMSKILDVGCGSGAWLYALAQSGFGNLFGCDPFLDHDIRYGDRVYIKASTIHEIEDDASFDRIHMGDSLEHVTDPLEVMISAKRLLKTNGIIEIHIPTYPNIAFDMFGPHWYQLDAPRHITLHSRKSIETLVRKAGLSISRFIYDSNEMQIIRSFFYQHGVSYNDITRDLIMQYFSEANIEEIRKKTAEFNAKGYGDHMIVYIKHAQEQYTDKHPSKE